MMRNGNGNTTQTVTTRPATTDRTGWVLFLGGGLLVVNFVFGNGAPVAGYLLGKQPLSATQQLQWGQYVLSALALLILLGIAATGETGSNFAVIFLIAVWIVWLLNNNKSLATILGQSSSTSSSPSSSSPSSNTTTGKPVVGEK